MRSYLLAATATLALSACATIETASAPISVPEPVAETVSPLAARAELPMQASDPYYVSAAEAVTVRQSDDFQPSAKNVILFVGDGMGISTITAARIYAGQQRGVDGESYKLAMDTLPHSALSRTYSHDYQVPDSASTATAMVAGVKTRSGTLGLRSGVVTGECASKDGQGTDTLFELAERKGLATGIVSTARITHATPASTFAESASRGWESDMTTPEGCVDIARQLIEWPEGDGFEVVLGGGRGAFMTDETFDPEYADKTGWRGDETDLMAAWAAKSDDHVTFTDGAGFAATNFNSDTRALGLFEPSHMQYELDRAEDAGTEPSLAELTEAAITRLSRDQDGYVLMVEGGRIDHAHHGVNAARALADTDAFDQAVAAAVEMVGQDTLIIVTADHSHTMTMAGYPRRNNDILGKVVGGDGEVATADDKLPYTTLGYTNGQTGCGEDKFCKRQDLSDVDTSAKNYLQQSLIFKESETHGGEDVAIFASGPGAELVRGVMEQNEIFHVMGYASGLVASE